MLMSRRSQDRLIFNMGIPIPGKDSLNIEMDLMFLQGRVKQVSEACQQARAAKSFHAGRQHT